MRLIQVAATRERQTKAFQLAVEPERFRGLGRFPNPLGIGQELDLDVRLVAPAEQVLVLKIGQDRRPQRLKLAF